MEIKDYLTLEDFATKHRWISVGALRWLVKEAVRGIEDLDAVFHHTKKGVLIDEEKFLKYYNSCESDITDGTKYVNIETLVEEKTDEN